MSKSVSVLKQLGSARLMPTTPAPSLSAFAALCSQKATREQYPLALSIEKNVPVYKLPPMASCSPEQRAALQDEWYRVLLDGPGVLVAKQLFPNHRLLDRSSSTLMDIIRSEREASTSRQGGDHFAGAGKNDRVWNSFSKQCLADPASFVEYYANPWLGLIASSWLGSGYRITAQVNNVKPGGEAQVCHRDYHLGFMSEERCARIPQAMHVASQFLTLQGAVAHLDTPLESGPTRLLPYSQAFAPGYLAYRLPEFNDFFLDNYVALPLEKGDGLFFNPALFHAAGTNQSPKDRLANLLQISSPFGKPMESIDTRPLLVSCWDEMLHLARERGFGDEVDAILAAVGQGYPFPTNLDRNPPRNEEMAPQSEQGLLRELLREGKDKKSVLEAFDEFHRNTQA
ncbi:hypothetical protein HIM_08462 [Hirsutella minnesotensis 3608]|uniref:Phytanoyl-CoA dioxygenase n=1 Tax=Hirsutella minnesotensis 3608 TaxID=1043627 RepID=A0A0F7ZYB8_9HYPO|nr:hypothetical protein HIM_08462 [Hirsutella minnesotensis 3608]